MKRYFAILIQGLFILCNCFGYRGFALASWENKGLYGGQIQALAISPKDSNVVFVGSWSGDGFFKSTDGGIHWENNEYFRNGEVFSIAIGGEQKKTIWAAYNVFLAKSVDEGSSWANCFSAEEERFCYCVVIHPQDENTLYLGCGGPQGSDSGGVIFKTTDGGKSWKRLALTADHNIRSIAIRKSKPEEVWAVSGREFVDEGSIYKSVDGGESWMSLPIGLKESWFDEIVLTTDDPPIIFVGGGKGVYRSKDGGISWSQLSISDWPEDSWCRALVLDPSDSHKVYAQCYYKFSKSSDAGDHWETYDLILGDAKFELLSVSVDPQRRGVIYGGDASLGVIKSENDGRDWNMVNQGISANHIFRTVLNPHNPQMMAASTMLGVYSKQEDSQWEVLDYDPSYALAFDPQNGLTLFAGFDGWLGKFSLESGEATYLEFPDQTITAVSFNPSNSDILYLGTEFFSLDRGGFYKSIDGGDSWERVLTKSAPINVVKVNPKNPDMLYAGSGFFYAPVIKGNLYKSTDKGKSWRVTSLGDMVINTIAIDPKYPEIIYVGSGAPDVDQAAGVFKSVDMGSTWQWSSKGLPLGSPVVDIELDPDNTQTLYAATFEKGVFISRDGGEGWTLLGMSDYWTYDVTSSSFYEKVSRVHSSSSMANRFYTGTASGLYQYDSAGTGMVTGMITDSATARGITGVQVVANTGGVAYTVEGAYLLVTAAGGCTISISAEGYSSGSRTITVVSGDTVSLDFTLTSLSEPGTISGIVTDFSTESPVEGATILVDPGGYSTQSLTEGVYSLGDVVPATYSVSAFREGYSVDRESGVDVSEGGTQNVDLRLSLLGTGSVEGIISDALSGEIMEGVEVNVDPGNFFNTSDSEGSYIISDIKTGNYLLSVSQEGYFPYQRGNIEVGQEETVTIDITLQPCPFDTLGLSNKKLEKIRRFRDEILSQSQEGRKWVSLFYQHAPAISRYIVSDPAVKAEMLELLRVLLPKIDYILAVKRVGLPHQLIREAEECVKRLSRKGEHKLKADINQLISILHDEKALKQFGVVLEKQAQN